MAMRTKDTLFNAAIYNTGLRPGNQTGVWEAMDANYEEIVRAAFEDADGTVPFGKGRVTLTSRSNGTFGYDDAFTLPNDVIHLIEIFLDGRSASDVQEPWEIDAINNVLLVNAAERPVAIEYVKEGGENTWSSNFALGIQRRLEAVIKNILEETEEASLKEQEADMFFMKAGVKGAKNRSSRRVWKRGGGRLLRARNG
ncbi:hypothetical protein [Pseudooceanicola nitratireducens]|uniref:hypothetical protein n=1 Tax=Pseudooceanicola nitratireducens TaxID=517719 RepID=UPI003C7D68BB